MTLSRYVIPVLVSALLFTQQLYAEQPIPSTNSSVTFLYYKELSEAENFYGNILGFEKDFDGDWVKIFKAANGGRVGLVDEKKGYLGTAENKPVMFSLDTSEVKAWYKRILERGEKYIVKHLKPESDGFVDGFLLMDPGGYHVEFFQWKEDQKSE